MTSQTPSELRNRAWPNLATQAFDHDLGDMFAAAPLSMVQLDLDGVVREAQFHDGPRLGFRAEDIIGQSLYTIESGNDEATRCFEIVRSTGRPTQQIRAIRHEAEPTGQHTYNTIWYPIFDTEGSPIAVGAVTEDISEIEQRESTLKHIARELQHRVKNTLANVIALVEQAERSSKTRPDALTILKQRVMALAQTHSRLTESNWGPTSLRSLLEQETTRVYGADSVDLAGPDLLMTAQSGLAFAMALHEMMANAANYGALSQGHGKVTLHWAIDPVGDDGGWINFDWKESGGPTTHDDIPPNGFGHRLIDASLRTSLRGRMERIWEADGLRYRFSLPLALISGS
mgnify:CR=1 FL=1